MPPYQGTVAKVRQAVIDRVKMEVGVDSTRVLEWMNLAYAQICQETGCLQGCATTALTADADGYSLPPEVQWVKAIHYTFQDGTISRPLQLISLDEMLDLRRRDSGRSGATQSYYSLLGQNRLELWPDPGPGAMLKFWYAFAPPQLAADTDTFLIAEPYGSKLIELGACVEASKFKKDPLIQSYMQEYSQWMERFQGWLNKRRTGTGVSMDMIVDTFDYSRPTLELVSNG